MKAPPQLDLIEGMVGLRPSRRETGTKAIISRSLSFTLHTNNN